MRLLDADEAKKALTGWDTDPTDEEIEYTIDHLPTVDAVEVVHGRWDDECRCTVCGWYGEDWYKRDVYYFDYCPNCGAKMDGDSHD